MNVDRDRVEGCLLGCAVGDSLGLPFEGLSPRRIAKMSPFPLRHRFVFGSGMVSDDTDHSIFVAQALCLHPTDPGKFARSLAWRFRWWLLCLPAGIGLATLRSTLRLWAGVPPSRSGVFSAGNGAAMRSAIIGVYHAGNPGLRQRFVSASSRITHSDPKADYGAQAVAAIAAEVTPLSGQRPKLPRLRELLEEISQDREWRIVVERILDLCEGEHCLSDDFPTQGVTGYIYETLPAAIASWYRHFGDFESTIETVICLGGDTDTVAAIAGALAGASLGTEGIPEQLANGIADWPHGERYVRSIARSLEAGEKRRVGFSPWLALRGLFFTAVVLVHGMRRLLPPY